MCALGVTDEGPTASEIHPVWSDATVRGHVRARSVRLQRAFSNAMFDMMFTKMGRNGWLKTVGFACECAWLIFPRIR